MSGTRSWSGSTWKALKDLAVPLYQRAKPGLPAHIRFPMDMELGKVTHYMPMAMIFLAGEKRLIRLEPDKTYPVMCMVLR